MRATFMADLLVGWVIPSLLTATSTGVVHAIKWAVQRARYMSLVWGLNCQAVMSDRYRFPFILAVSVFGVRGRLRIDRNESGGDRPRTERRHGISDRKPKSHSMQKTTNAA